MLPFVAVLEAWHAQGRAMGWPARSCWCSLQRFRGPSCRNPGRPIFSLATVGVPHRIVGLFWVGGGRRARTWSELESRL
jgi:hypothetical protein